MMVMMSSAIVVLCYRHQTPRRATASPRVHVWRTSGTPFLRAVPTLRVAMVRPPAPACKGLWCVRTTMMSSWRTRAARRRPSLLRPRPTARVVCAIMSCQLINQYKNPTNQPTNQLTNQLTTHPTNWPPTQLTAKKWQLANNQPTNQLTNHVTNQPTSQPANQPTN